MSYKIRLPRIVLAVPVLALLGLAAAVGLTASASPDSEGSYEAILETARLFALDQGGQGQQGSHAEGSALSGKLRCGTPFLLEVSRNWEAYPEWLKRELEGVGFWQGSYAAPRPGFTTTIVSTLYPLEVHYPDNVSTEYAEKVLGFFETSWEIEVNQIGFIAPPPDRGSGGSDNYDVYIQRIGGALGYTAAEYSVPETEWYDATSYIVIDASIFNDKVLKATCAHEFNHACQMATDLAETIAFFENTSTWIEDQVFDDANDYYYYLYDFVHNPEDAWQRANGPGLYIYGGGQVLFYFDEKYGNSDPAIVRDLWEESKQRGSVNEPDSFDAVPIVLANWGHTDGFDEAFTDFANWQYIAGPDDDGNHFEEGAAWGANGKVKVMSAHKHDSYPAFSPTTLPQPPQPAGSNIIEFRNLPESLRIFFEGEEGVSWGVSAITVTETGGTYTTMPVVLNTFAEGGLTINGADAYEKIVLVVSNLGAEDYDPDKGNKNVGADYSYVATSSSGTQLESIVSALGPGHSPQVEIHDFQGSQVPVTFQAYDSSFQGGVYVACGDLDSSGYDEIIVGPGEGMAPRVRAFSMFGKLVTTTDFLAYRETMTRGVRVAAGDVNGDGIDEIITVPGAGAKAHVRIFRPDGRPLNSGFIALGPGFTGGAFVAAGDVDGDGSAEIIVGPDRGFSPNVRMFEMDGTPIGTFRAYKDTFLGGVRVACADLTGDGVDEIITGPGFSGGPHVRAFLFNGAPSGTSFMAYRTHFRGGVFVAGGDLSQQVLGDVATGADRNGAAHVRTFRADGSPITSYFADSGGLRTGVRVAVGQFGY